MILPSQPGRGLVCLPNHVRESMLQSGAGKGLVILEALYMLNVKPESWLTFDQIFRLCQDNFDSSFRLVYEGLRHPLIFQRRKAAGFTSRRGPRPFLYRVPTIQEIAVEFGSNLPHSPTDTLKKPDLRSLRTYRLALHREMFIRRWIDNKGKGFSMSRKLMAERLGVSARTVQTYDQELGFSNEPNYKEHPVTWDNWHLLPRYKTHYDRDGRRLPSKQFLKVVNEASTTVRRLPLVRYLAFEALSVKAYVSVVERLPNTYYPYQKADLSGFESWDVASHYIAELEAKNAAGFFQDNAGNWYHRRE